VFGMPGLVRDWGRIKGKPKLNVPLAVRAARRGRAFVIEFESSLGAGCYQDTRRILMSHDVSCVYPEGYMYPSCILMYLKCILNALLHSKRIHVS
jgi:hypothetical protein